VKALTHPRLQHRLPRACATAVILAVAVCSPVLAVPGTVYTKDGKSVLGDVIETPQTIVVRTKEGVRVIPRDQVQKIEQAPATSTTAPAASSPSPDSPGATQPSSQPSQPAGVSAARLLTLDEVNRVRQVETAVDDKLVTFKFDLDAEKEFCRDTGMTLGAFRGLPPLQRFLAMRSKASPRVLDRIRVLRDPRSIADFRSSLQKPVLVGCASAGCHGGPLGGSFVLTNPALDEASTYTNFYTLATYAGRNGGQMIDRVTPASSLLLQYGLPTLAANTPHPKVAGFKPPFKGKDDEKYLRLLDWITNDLQPLVNGYGFTPGPPAGDTDTVKPDAK
jgi:hypothetical protein